MYCSCVNIVVTRFMSNEYLYNLGNEIIITQRNTGQKVQHIINQHNVLRDSGVKRVGGRCVCVYGGWEGGRRGREGRRR